MNDLAAFWSAVAASFSAFSSILILRIQRRSLLASAHPELVLTGWTRNAAGQGESAHEIIGFQTIRNVGRGTAVHILLHSFNELADKPTAILSTTRLPILAANEATDVNGQIPVWWKNVEADHAGFKYIAITITIYCWDSAGMRHETRYSLFAVELSANIGMQDAIAPGVALTERTTTAKPAWRLKLSSRFRRISGLDRLVRKAK